MSLLDMPDNTPAGLVREQIKVLRKLTRLTNSVNENLVVLVGCTSGGVPTEEQYELLTKLKEILMELEPESLLLRVSHKPTYKDTHNYIHELKNAIRRASSYTGLGPEFDGKKEEE